MMRRLIARARVWMLDRQINGCLREIGRASELAELSEQIKDREVAKVSGLMLRRGSMARSLQIK